MVDSTAGEGNWSQPRVRAPHCARQPRLTQPATTNRSEIPLISEHQADAGRIREPGRLADDVPTQFAFDSAAAAEQVLGADAEVDSTASLGIRVGCILEELTHEVRASACGHKRQEVFVLEVVHAVEQQLHLAEVKLLFNGVYYFKHENFLPFVTAGAGAYFVRQLFENAPDPDSETRGGINFGVGTEYLLGGGGAVKGELRWDIVSQPTGFPDATGVSITIGY